MNTLKTTGSRIATAAGLCIAALQCFAQPSTPSVDQRQTNQAARIAKGEQTGALSNREAARMKAGQQKVADLKANATADGKVTVAERKAIKREQNKQSRRIARQKMDGNKR